VSTAVKQRAQPVPQQEGPPPPGLLYRFSVEQFQRMTGLGILTPDDRAELLEGWIVQKMTQHPPHAVAIDLVHDALRPLLPQGWRVRDQKPILLADSLPEPDLTVVRGPLGRYLDQHPRPRDVAVVIEVADSSLDEDRVRKGRVYARARLPLYWIINLVDEQVEVYSRPKAGKTPAYQDRRDYLADGSVPLVLDGQEVGQVPVARMIPKLFREASET
jgi:Uma2 family endonuclease